MEEPRRQLVIVGAIAAHAIAAVLLIVVVPDLVRLVLPEAPSVLSTVRRVTVAAGTTGAGGAGSGSVREVAPTVGIPTIPVPAEPPVVLATKPTTAVKPKVRGATKARETIGANANIALSGPAGGASGGAGVEAGAGAGGASDAGAGTEKGTHPGTEKVEPREPAEPSPEDVASWSAAIAAQVGARVKYPAAAVEDELEGTTYVSMTVAADGSMSDLKIAKSSGEALLDDSALRQLAAIGKVTAPPGGRARAVRVPVRFRLDR